MSLAEGDFVMEGNAPTNSEFVTLSAHPDSEFVTLNAHPPVTVTAIPDSVIPSSCLVLDIDVDDDSHQVWNNSNARSLGCTSARQENGQDENEVYVMNVRILLLLSCVFVC